MHGSKHRKRIPLDKNNGGPRRRSQEEKLSRAYATRQFHHEHFMKFLDLYRRSGCNGPWAAKMLKTNSVQVRAWREQMPWFAAAMDEIVDEVFGAAVGTVFKSSKRVGGARWLLLNHSKGRDLGFGQRMDMSSKEEKNFTLTMRMEVDQLKRTYTREELEQLHQLLTKASRQSTDQLGELTENGDSGTATVIVPESSSGGELPSGIL